MSTISTAVEVDADFAAMLESLFADIADSESPDVAAPGLGRDRWTALGSLGLTLLTRPENVGGSGAGWPEAWSLHHAAARHGIQLPLGEHDLLGRWLADQLGWETGDDVVSVGLSNSSGTVDVPWGVDVDSVLLIDARGERPIVSRLRSEELTWCVEGRMPGSRRARVVPPAESRAVELDPALLRELHLRGAVLRSMQITGALEKCVEIAVEHAVVRVQFGRPLAAFQAVQAMLADAAAEVELARAATMAAVAALSLRDDVSASAVPIAVAKSCTSHAVGPVTRRAHQILGAIGTTREHALHRFSMPPLGWRDEFGTGAEWDRELGETVSERGWTSVWQGIIDGGFDG